MDLGGKTAVVTGAGRGIGRATALSLAREGCRVVPVSRTEDELKEVEREIRDAGGEACAVTADITRPEDIDRIIETVVDTYHSLEILINNAGTHVATPFLDIGEREWNENMNTNLKAMLFLSQAALRIMQKQRQGYIINISSPLPCRFPPGPRCTASRSWAWSD